MNAESIKSFWNNGFDKGCDEDKLIVAARNDINLLLEKNDQLEKMQKELTRVIARNLIAWDTSKDKRHGLLPEVYLTNKYLYKQLTGEEYFQHKAMKKFHIGDDYS